MISVIGASGSGKSTLLYILGLLDEPSSGEIVFENQRVDFHDTEMLSEIRNRKIGFIFQFHYLIDELSAAENILVPLLKITPRRSEAKDRAYSLLSMLGLEGKEHRKPYQLSGGEQQRVAVARALANEPAIILADEPMGNLDTKNTDAIMKVLLSLNAKGTTILMVTHELNLAEKTKRTIEIRDGVITGATERN